MKNLSEESYDNSKEIEESIEKLLDEEEEAIPDLWKVNKIIKEKKKSIV